MHVRPIHIRDVPAFFELIEKSREHLQAYFPKTLTAVRDELTAEEYILQRIIQFERKEAFLFVIEAENRLLGMVSLKEIDWTVPKAEIAYFVAEEFQGKGIVTRALQWLVTYSFDELRLEKIYARISPENPASRKVVEKNGFVLEGLFRKDFRSGTGELIDVEYFALLRPGR